MVQFAERLSGRMYSWVLDTSEGNPIGSGFTQIFSNDPDGGHGMEWAFYFLVVVSVVSAAIFYYGVASDINKATKKNYVMTWIMGFVALVALNYVGIQVAVDPNVLTSMNMVRLCLIDAVYYTILFELSSLCMKGSSNAANIHRPLWTVFFSK